MLETVSRLNSQIKAENIYLKAIVFKVQETATGKFEIFTLPERTIYNEIGYSVRRQLLLKNTHEVGYFNSMSILLLVSVKDRKIQGDEALRIEAAFPEHQTMAHLYWITLELFRSVSRLISRLNMEVPKILKNEEQAWKSLFDSESNQKSKSKKQYIKNIRFMAKSIRENKNPFDSESPELKIFIDKAIDLSQGNENGNKEPNDVRTLRKHIRQKLKDFERALTGYATYLDRNPCQFIVKTQGHLWERGIKNNIKMRI